MKLHLLIAAFVLLICSGCVAYTYSDPYYSTYPYNYYYSPYFYPSGPFIYPDIFLDFHDHGHVGGFHGHRNFHGNHRFQGGGVFPNYSGFHGREGRR
jgi:hypothetical protein